MIPEEERFSKFRLLAAIDMEETIDAALLLKKFYTKEFSWPNGRLHHLIKAIETAVVVSYVRPFSSSYYTKKLTDEDVIHLTQEEKVLHAELLGLRHRRYAHTDAPEKSMRNAEIIGKKNTEGYGFTESWVPLGQTKLGLIVSMCTSNREKWRADQLEKRE